MRTRGKDGLRHSVLPLRGVPLLIAFHCQAKVSDPQSVVRHDKDVLRLDVPACIAIQPHKDMLDSNTQAMLVRAQQRCKVPEEIPVCMQRVPRWP